MTIRRCYKCPGCLAVYAITHDRPEHNFACSVCGTNKLRYLGRVEKQAIVNEEFRCKCDERCVFATGPNCDCQCGGANHQSGIEGYTEVTVMHDGEKILDITNLAIRDKHLKIFTEYMQATSAALERRKVLTPDRYHKDDHKYSKARAMQSHHHRIKKLNECYGGNSRG